MTFKTKLNPDGTVQVTHTVNRSELVYTLFEDLYDNNRVYVIRGTKYDLSTRLTKSVLMEDLVESLEEMSNDSVKFSGLIYKTVNTLPIQDNDPKININIPDDFDINKLPEAIFKVLRERGTTL